jgi:hypothetical protein
VNDLAEVSTSQYINSRKINAYWNSLLHLLINRWRIRVKKESKIRPTDLEE